MPGAGKRLYLIPVLSRALDVLELLQSSPDPLTLNELHTRTKLPKTTLYRVVKTFMHRGYVTQLADGSFRHVAKQKKICFGFGVQHAAMAFPMEVTRSLELAAAEASVELLVLDNRYDSAAAVGNADAFIQRQVDVVIEFQVEQAVAPLIGDRIAAAKIPLIAVDIPHPHATYFGVDNFRIGFEAGELLSQHALAVWAGKVDLVVGLDLPEAGPLVQSRISGAFEAVRASLPGLPSESFVRYDGRGLRETSRAVIAELIEKLPRNRRVLVAAVNDTSALGAVDAIREAKRERTFAVVGQDCISEAVEEMRATDSPLIGTISHETANYGPALVALGLALLRGQTVAPYNYVAHKAVSKQSLLQLV